MLRNEVIQWNERALWAVLVDHILDFVATHDVWDVARSKHQVVCFLRTWSVCTESRTDQVNTCVLTSFLLNRPVAVIVVALIVQVNSKFHRLIYNSQVTVCKRRRCH